MKLWQYKAIVSRVVDGDTIDVDIDLGFGIWKKEARVRLKGVDTPEKRTRNLLEKQFGLLASHTVEGICPKGSEIMLETSLAKKGKFGRILGVIFLDNQININEYLIENHLAVRYEGQSKAKVQKDHLKNFKFLVDSGKVILNENLSFPK